MFITEKDFEECLDKGIIHTEQKTAEQRALRQNQQDSRKSVFCFVKVDSKHANVIGDYIKEIVEELDEDVEEKMKKTVSKKSKKK